MIIYITDTWYHGTQSYFCSGCLTFNVLFFCFSPHNRDIWLGVVQMELKTLTPLLKENRPIVQKAMVTWQRDSASPEPRLALAKALRVGLHIQYKQYKSFAEFFIHINGMVAWFLFPQILQTWSERQITMSLRHWRPREMHPPPNLSWTSPAPMPLMMRARPKIKPAETQIRTFPIGQSAAAVTKRTTSTWNVQPQGVILLVNLLPFFHFYTYLVKNIPDCLRDHMEHAFCIVISCIVIILQI